MITLSAKEEGSTNLEHCDNYDISNKVIKTPKEYYGRQNNNHQTLITEQLFGMKSRAKHCPQTDYKIVHILFRKE